MPLEKAKYQKITSINDVTINQIIDYPAKGLVFKGRSHKQLAQSAMGFVKFLQQENIPHHLVIIRDTVFVLPRNFQRPTAIGGVGLIELLGDMEVGVSDETIYTNLTEEQIVNFIKEIQLSDEKFQNIVKSDNIKYDLDEIISYFVVKSGIRINHV